MAYDKACYLRRKNQTLKKTTNDDFIAYKEIRAKWGFSDMEIHKLLQTHALSEILAGEMIGNKFYPKELYYI